jgi:hypothetical protein
MDDNFCYIIDEYNKFQINKNVVKTFNLFIGGRYVPYCIRKIPLTYDWGTPILEDWIEQDWDIDYSDQYIFPTEKEALAYVRRLRGR